MKNVKSVITNHNNTIIAKNTMPPTLNKKMCNCRNLSFCPLEGKFPTKSIVYKVSITEETAARQKLSLHQQHRGAIPKPQEVLHQSLVCKYPYTVHRHRKICIFCMSKFRAGFAISEHKYLIITSSSRLSSAVAEYTHVLPNHTNHSGPS